MMDGLFYDLIETSSGFIGLVFKKDESLVLIMLPSKNKTEVEKLIFQYLSKKNVSGLNESNYSNKHFFIDYFKGINVFDKINFNYDFPKYDLDFFNPTSFQREVWKTISIIPYSKTISYKKLGIMLGCKAYRAIGSALGKNPLPLLFPCHRVVSSSGIGGFSAIEGVKLKEKMLSIEFS